MKTQVSFFILLVVASIFALPHTYACTGLRLIAADNGVVVGRTLEFGLDPQSEILVLPAGSKIFSSLPDKSKGISYTSKYGIVGANGFGFDVHIDGINDTGLYVGGFYFPGYASYNQPDPQKYAVSMAAEDYGTWLLANFSSVEEVKANFDKVFLVENPIEAIGGMSFPAHYIIHDRTGACIVIEPLNKTLVIYDNPVGVFTNSPAFDWHMTNLNNYINLSVVNVEPVDFNGTNFSAFGEGSGLHGLPGDGTPPSRFVRATVYSQSAEQKESAEETVPQVFHLMNNFDIPVGSVRDVVKSGEEETVINEITSWTTVIDLKNLTYSFKTYQGQNVLQVDVKKALAEAKYEAQHIPMSSEFNIKDVSTDFVN
ncbi:choloylglycine hydrolase family protein [Draconibacterium sp. IB214405]|uniref:choloylglycine hydrolase family protein n=1 Tax=Draconibacterium sp. IB214405 TaxID=3097352 RepID=UPI002A16B973|nr:choloylglycine hydrolase family protein [Draconibacterium sp. IB214405]MDX8341739.1 choloylglycine hydrolase family protein [Draconibacterium sp. IB214405]